MTFQAGQVVGEYKVVRVLGRGGLGAVYEAVHLISQRAEAMKVMLAERTGTPDMKERFGGKSSFSPVSIIPISPACITPSILKISSSWSWSW